jgi:uncharacterized protein YciI
MRIAFGIGLLLVAPLLAAEEPAVTPAPAIRTERAFQMDHYVMAFLRKGPAWTAGDTPEIQAIQEGHMANITRMAATGHLVVAGPFEDGGDLRGLFLFHGLTMDEAKALAAEDPAVKANRLVLEWHPWFAGKGIAIVQTEDDLAKAALAAGLQASLAAPPPPSTR